MNKKLIVLLLIFSGIMFSGCVDDSSKVTENKIVQIIRYQQNNEIYYDVYYIDFNSTFMKTFKEHTDDQYKYVIRSNKTRYVNEKINGVIGNTNILYLNTSDLDSQGIYVTGYSTG